MIFDPQEEVLQVVLLSIKFRSAYTKTHLHVCCTYYACKVIQCWLIICKYLQLSITVSEQEVKDKHGIMLFGIDISCMPVLDYWLIFVLNVFIFNN